MSSPPAWKTRDETIAQAFRNYIEEREAAWKVYFEAVAAEKKATKKATP